MRVKWMSSYISGGTGVLLNGVRCCRRIAVCSQLTYCCHSVWCQLFCWYQFCIEIIMSLCFTCACVLVSYILAFNVWILVNFVHFPNFSLYSIALWHIPYCYLWSHLIPCVHKSLCHIFSIFYLHLVSMSGFLVTLLLFSVCVFGCYKMTSFLVKSGVGVHHGPTISRTFKTQADPDTKLWNVGVILTPAPPPPCSLLCLTFLLFLLGSTTTRLLLFLFLLLFFLLLSRLIFLDLLSIFLFCKRNFVSVYLKESIHSFDNYIVVDSIGYIQ